MANTSNVALQEQVVENAAMQQVENTQADNAKPADCVERTDDSKKVEKVIKTFSKAVKDGFAELDTLQGQRGIAVKKARELGMDALAKVLNSDKCIVGLKKQFDHLCFAKLDGKGNAVGEPYIVMVRMVSLQKYNDSHKTAYADYNAQCIIDFLGDKSLKANKFALVGYQHDGTYVGTASFAELRHDYTHTERVWEERLVDGDMQRLKVFAKDLNGKTIYDDNGKPVQKEESITETYVPVIEKGNKVKREAFIEALCEWLQENAFSVLLAAAK